MRQSDQPLPEPPRNDRPGDNWICGWSDSGNPCQHGPSGTGTCPALAACRPSETGDGWVCNRPACLGGACDSGPHADGICGLKPDPCRPKRSWQNRRRMAALMCLVLAIGATCIALGGPWRTEAFAPGGLIQPHAQILGGALKSDRCAACHPAAKSQSLVSWFLSAGDAHANLTQTDLCMDCHHNTINRKFARHAHNLSLSDLNLVSSRQSVVDSKSWHKLLPASAVSNDDVACATCHREHHGAANNLLAMSSQQCQACHKQRFASFSDGHPDWNGWPYRSADASLVETSQPGGIRFNHATHAGKYFAQGGVEFDCAACHQRDANQEMLRSVSFEKGCASCHAKPLTLETAGGFDLVQLPTLNLEAIAASGNDVGAWPEAASGPFDGKISPVVRLLLRGDSEIGDALDQLPPGANLARVNPNNLVQMQALAKIAAGLRKLTHDLNVDTRKTVAKRLSLATGISPDLAARIAGRLSRQLIQPAWKQWFPDGDSVVYTPRLVRPFEIRLVADWQVSPKNPLRPSPMRKKSDAPVTRIAEAPQELDDLLGPAASAPINSQASGGLIDDDPLGDVFAVPKPKKKPKPKRFNPEKELPTGGWYIDSLSLAVRYLPHGHDDHVLMALVELATSAPMMERSDRAALLAMPAVKSCLECHGTPVAGAYESWTSLAPASSKRSFTKFSHRPHMNLPLLNDCKYCHSINTEGVASNAVQTVSVNSHEYSEFHPLTRQACVKCHTSTAAGEQCTQCHRYHIGDQPPSLLRTPPQVVDLLKSDALLR